MRYLGPCRRQGLIPNTTPWPYTPPPVVVLYKVPAASGPARPRGLPTRTLEPVAFIAAAWRTLTPAAVHLPARFRVKARDAVPCFQLPAISVASWLILPS